MDSINTQIIRMHVQYVSQKQLESVLDAYWRLCSVVSIHISDSTYTQIFILIY